MTPGEAMSWLRAWASQASCQSSWRPCRCSVCEARRIAMIALGDATASVLADVAAERERQTAKWGVQTHADGTGSTMQKWEIDAGVLPPVPEERP